MLEPDQVRPSAPNQVSFTWVRREPAWSVGFDWFGKWRICCCESARNRKTSTRSICVISGLREFPMFFLRYYQGTEDQEDLQTKVAHSSWGMTVPAIGKHEITSLPESSHVCSACRTPGRSAMICRGTLWRLWVGVCVGQMASRWGREAEADIRDDDDEHSLVALRERTLSRWPKQTKTTLTLTIGPQTLLLCNTT